MIAQELKEIRKVENQSKFSVYGKEIDLLMFAKGGNIELVRELWKKHLGKGDLGKIVDKAGYNALHLAAGSDQAAMCKLLVEELGMDKESRTANGMTALHVAAQRGKHNAVEMLLSLGCDPNVKDNEYSDSPLHKAMWEGRLKCIVPLLKGGASLDQLDDDGCTPVRLAEINRRLDILNLLTSIQTNKLQPLQPRKRR